MFSLELNFVAFAIFDVDGDGLISNGELFQVLKLMGFFLHLM